MNLAVSVDTELNWVLEIYIIKKFWVKIETKNYLLLFKVVSY